MITYAETLLECTVIGAAKIFSFPWFPFSTTGPFLMQCLRSSDGDGVEGPGVGVAWVAGGRHPKRAKGYPLVFYISKIIVLFVDLYKFIRKSLFFS